MILVLPSCANRTAHLNVIQTEAWRGHHRKGKQNKFSRSLILRFRDMFTVLTFMQSLQCYYVH